MSVLLLSLLLAQDAATLIEQLRSDSVVEREAAGKGLIALGAAARPALEKAAMDSDSEVASRARSILRLLDLHERVGPRIAKVAPGAAERLASGDDEAWCALFVELFASSFSVAVKEPVEPRDLDFLAPRALKGARELQTKARLAAAAERFGLRSAIPGLMAYLLEEDAHPRTVAFQALRSLRPREIVPELLRRVAETEGHAAEVAADLLVALEARETAPDLLRMLSSPRPEARGHAARSLARLGVKEARGPITGLLEDKEAAVVGAAAWALVELRGLESIPDLRRQLEKRGAAGGDLLADALGRLGAKEAAPDLIRLLGDETPLSLREAAAVALSRLGRKEAIPALGSLLGNEEAFDREAVLEALVRLEAREALPDLLRALRDESADLRRKTVRAIRTLKLKDAVPALIVKLGDADVTVREEALRTVAELAGNEVGPKVLAVLTDAERPKFERAAAASLLGRVGYAEASKALRGLLNDPKRESELRRASAHALADLRCREAWEDLREAVKDGDFPVRQAAVLSLARIGAREARDDILARLKDEGEEYDVREAAATALGWLGGKEAVGPLLELIRNEGIQAQVAMALGRIGDKDALPGLLQLLDDPDEPASREVIDAAARLDRAETVKRLRAMLKSGSDEFRVRAAEGLCRLGEREGAAVLVEFGISSPDVPLHSLNALRRPDLWKELGGRHCRWDFEAEAMEVVAQLELITGLAVETSESQGTTFVLSEDVQQGWETVLRALEENETSFVLEPGRVKLLSRYQELKFWQDWLREEEKRK